ncbi:hypothetical protein M569_14504, partial [Genlisea aurea]
LIRSAEDGCVEEAKSTLDFMLRSDFIPDRTVFTVLLKSCIRRRRFELGREVHSLVIESGIEFDAILFNSLISLYAKSGDWRKADEIFGSMGEMKDLVSWSAMVSCYSLNGLNSRAISLFIEMVISGENPNEYCFSGALRACWNREFAATGLVIFGFLTKTGHFHSDVSVGCALIETFAKGFADLDSAKKVFDEMPDKNSVTWTLIITRFAQLGCPEEAIELFLDMVIAGFQPDQYTFSSCLSACAELGSAAVGRQLHSWAIKNGSISDVCVGCSLVDMYVKSCLNGSVAESRKVFDAMLEHNVMSWTAIITGCAQNGGLPDEALRLYCRMMTEGTVKPNHFTFSAVLKACGDLFNPRLGEAIYGQSVKLGFATVNCVGNSLISMYTRNDRMDEARRAFEFLVHKNLVSYNALIDGYSKSTDSHEAFDLLNRVETSEFGIDAFTFASLLSGAASIGAVGKGEQLHGRLLKSGFESDLCVSNALISMYTRCGDLRSGFKIFDGIENRNIVSWTSIITGCAKHGFAETALELFHRMTETGIRPNDVTFVSILSACSHAGLVEEGWKYFRSMSEDHGMAPKVEHYACMVDILSRSGHLDRAMRFIDTMPYPPDALIWRTLLGACLVHGNVELGRLAARSILEKNPDDPAAHVLLSNLLASKGQWGEAAAIRKEMRSRNVVKEAGSSWIEVDATVHKFYAGDSKHPEAAAIYGELDRVVGEAKGMGYVPVTDGVVLQQDVEEEEEKERYVFQHSEKIALGYGLIRSRGGKGKKVLRIFKNLRVCGDCHNFIKFASMACGREIVVRDSNRFHHFKDGRCSCNDYW